MEDSYRLFNCGRCRKQTKICPRCDRGQIYCEKSCSEASRREKQREAGRRYQRSRRGRFKHAARQQRYRERQAEKVTHQGPPDRPERSIVRPTEADEEPTRAADVVSCDFCGRVCRPFARLVPLRVRRRTRLRISRDRAR